MRLYLSSEGVGSSPEALRAHEPGAAAWVILNALDPYGAARAGELAHQRACLAALGYAADELDLRDFEDRSEDLATALAGVSLVWVAGGNTFALARAMTRSGFRSALLPQWERTDFRYGGYSAGAVVAGPDLAAIDRVDDVTVLDNASGREEVETLGLLPFRVIPHWRSPNPESAAIDRVVDVLTESGLAHRCLSDGEALVVDGESVEVVGSPR